jgi:Holliday junction resolvase RusA-like endonuclease
LDPKTRELFVPGPLPGQNEWIAAAKSGHGKRNGYGRLKAQWTSLVANLARAAKLEPLRGPVYVSLVWREASRRRDPDNVEAGVKAVLDGLVEAGVLEGDGWRHIAAISHVFTIDANPGVHVTLRLT